MVVLLWVLLMIAAAAVFVVAADDDDDDDDDPALGMMITVPRNGRGDEIGNWRFVRSVFRPL